MLGRKLLILKISFPPDAAERGRTEPFRQQHAIFDLRRDHVAIEVATRRFSANLASAAAGPYLLVERCPSFVMIEFCLAEVLLVGDSALVDALADDE
jgi:hypothetical protein